MIYAADYACVRARHRKAVIYLFFPATEGPRDTARRACIAYYTTKPIAASDEPRRLPAGVDRPRAMAGPFAPRRCIMGPIDHACLRPLDCATDGQPDLCRRRSVTKQNEKTNKQTRTIKASEMTESLHRHYTRSHRKNCLKR